MPNTPDPPFSISGRGLLPGGLAGRAVGPVSYPGPVKVRVCRALHGDWAELADYVGVPPEQRARFAAGREPSELWDWLERRDRLGELTGALRALGLTHCADLLHER